MNDDLGTGDYNGLISNGDCNGVFHLIIVTNFDCIIFI